MSTRKSRSGAEDSSTRIPREPGYYHSERIARHRQPVQNHVLGQFSFLLKIVMVVAILVLIAVIAFLATRQSDGGTSDSGSAASGEESSSNISFTTADAGSCLMWDTTENGIENFEQRDCSMEHRFEVSSREDLSTYPASEFGEDAAMPDVERQAQLREELCLNPTIQYLQGDYDNRGRYSVASILPPADSWAAGDRTLLCGLQVTDDNGNVLVTTGKAQEQDQARIFAAGQCVQIIENNAIREVDCAGDHQLEITSVVDLQPIFPDWVPSEEEQDAYLQSRCTTDAQNYLGSEDALYYSTLTPFWLTVDANSWEAGSHSVNCALIAVDAEGGMATLAGSARSGFTINGQAPEVRAERAPVVNPDVYNQ